MSINTYKTFAQKFECIKMPRLMTKHHSTPIQHRPYNIVHNKSSIYLSSGSAIHNQISGDISTGISDNYICIGQGCSHIVNVDDDKIMKDYKIEDSTKTIVSDGGVGILVPSGVKIESFSAHITPNLKTFIKGELIVELWNKTSNSEFTRVNNALFRAKVDEDVKTANINQSCNIIIPSNSILVCTLRFLGEDANSKILPKIYITLTTSN